jgi:hypothetical protein
MIGLDWLNGSPARNQCFFLGRQQDAVRLSLTVAGAVSIDRLGAKLLVADVIGGVRNLPRTALASLFDPGDLVVANDAATLPASLRGTHRPSSEAAEVRLAAWVRLRDPERFIVIALAPAITVSAPRIVPRRRSCAKATVVRLRASSNSNSSFRVRSPISTDHVSDRGPVLDGRRVGRDHPRDCPSLSSRPPKAASRLRLPKAAHAPPERKDWPRPR